MQHQLNKKVSVIGLGYIGLPTAALLASKGYEVFGMDICKTTVDIINSGKIHIVEPELEKYVHLAVNKGLLKASTQVKPADVYMLCVPTPFHKNKSFPSPNIDHVIAATKSISQHIKDGDVVILESTSPVGTTSLVGSILKDEGVDINKIFIAYCPERVLPGSIMYEIVYNNRVVGGINSNSTKEIANFYNNFVKGEILETNAETAEMCKLTENSYRDVNIAFANELSMICANNGVDVWELIKQANYHPRVNILQPGTGVGGHCIAVDPWFIISGDRQNSQLIKKARDVNDSKPNWVVERIVENATLLNIQRPKIACLGLSFKPDIDDLRGSPAIEVIKGLKEKNFDIFCVEPNILSHKEFTIYLLDEAINKADLVVILVGHKEFRTETNKKYFRSLNTMDFCGVLV